MPPHITGADRAQLAAELAELYKAGQSIRNIAASIGRSYAFVHRLLIEASVQLRPRGGANRRPKPSGGVVMTPEQRSRRARIAALTRWSQEDPTANAQRGQAGLLEKFERQVDPENRLTPPERARRAAAARKAHMVRLSYLAVQAREARKQQADVGGAQ